MRARARAALPSIAVRISVCLPDDAVISQDECALELVTGCLDNCWTAGPARDP